MKTWWRATSVTQMLFFLSTVSMCGRWKKLAPHSWMTWPVLLRVRTVLTGIGLLRSPLYTLPLNVFPFHVLSPRWKMTGLP